LFSIDCVAEPLPNTAQTLEDHHFEEPESQQPYLDCLTQPWNREIHLFAGQLEEYSNEAHLSAVMAAMQYSEILPDTNPQNQDDFPPDRGCTGDFPARKLKNSWVPRTQKIETKKMSEPSQQNNSGHPQNCLYLILMMATEIHTRVHIIQCCHCVLPALAT
jgi:hypothetical protein